MIRSGLGLASREATILFITAEKTPPVNGLLKKTIVTSSVNS